MSAMSRPWQVSGQLESLEETAKYAVWHGKRTARSVVLRPRRGGLACAQAERAWAARNSMETMTRSMPSALGS